MAQSIQNPIKQETSFDKDQKFPGRMQKILWGWVVMERN